MATNFLKFCSMGSTNGVAFGDGVSGCWVCSRCRQNVHLVSGGGYWQWAIGGLGIGSGL